MSNSTIIAVGGTGTHAAIAFLRMAILSNIELQSIPNLIIVDADTINPNAEMQSLLTAASNLHTQLVSGVQGASRPYFCHFSPYVKPDNGHGGVAAETTFSSYLIGQRPELLNATDPRRKILDSLYSHREQSICISSGFFATPSVGASSIFDLLNQNGSLTQKLNELLRKNGEIAVVGSSTGGTGSGGAPAIAQWLANERDARNLESKIGLFMTLPWFEPVESSETPTDQHSMGTWEAQKANAAAGVRFYAESESLKGIAVFIADYDEHLQKRESSGNTGQPEVPHPFNILLASQIQNFFLFHLEKARGVYSFFHTSENKLLINASDSPLIAFSPSAGVRQDVEKWALDTQTIRIVLDKVADFLSWNYRIAPNGAQSHVEEQFTQFMLLLARKLGNGNIEKAGGFLGIGKKDIETQEVRDKLAKALKARGEQLADSIKWLDDARRNSPIGKDNYTLHISGNATLKSLPDNAFKNFPVFEKRNGVFPVVLDIFEKSFNDREMERIAGVNSSAKQIGTLFDNLTGNGRGSLEPVHAAAVVIEIRVREYIRAKTAGANHRLRDSDTTPALGNQVVKALVPMRIVSNADVVNHYLVKVDIAKLVDKGNGRNINDLAISDPNHPFTITGLRSACIPSPWASAQLQGWLGLYGRDTQKSHALGTFEAIMWGVFSKRLQVETLPLAGTRLGELLTGSLQKELGLLTTTQVNHLLVAVDANSPNDVVAINHPKMGWYLAPSLFEANRDKKWWLDKRFSITLPTEDAASHTDKAFTKRQYRAFYEYLLNTVQVLHTPNATNPVHIPWHNAVSGITKSLGVLLTNTQPAPSGLLNSQELHLWGQSTVGTVGVVSCPLIGLTQSQQDITKDYVSNCVVILKNESPDGTTRNYYPDFPIRPEKHQYINTCRRLNVDHVSGDDFVLQYAMEIDGLGEMIVDVPAKKMDFHSHVVLWPNFREDSWKQYYLGCEPSRAVKADGTIENSIRFTVYDEFMQPIGEKSRSLKTNHELIGIPKYFSIHFWMNGVRHEGGIFEINLEPITGANKMFNLGLDVGTSHSCIYPTDNTGNVISGVNFTQAVIDLSYPLFHDETQKAPVEKSVSFLGAYSAKIPTPPSVDGLVLPSEIKVHGKDKVYGKDITSAMINSRENFCIAPMQFSSPTDASRKGKEEFLSDFKWPVEVANDASTSQHGLIDTKFENHQVPILKIYMVHMMHLTLGILRSKNYKVLNKLRPTYPEAFDRPYTDDYAKTIVDVIQTVERTTGIIVSPAINLSDVNLLRWRDGFRQGLTSNDSYMVSESMAAISASGNAFNGPLNNRGVCLVLDMGGGTTDVALYATGLEPEDGNIASVSDSIRYAGNDVLALLATMEVIKPMFIAVSNSEEEFNKIAPDLIMDIGYRQHVLRRLLREPVAIDALRRAFTNPRFAHEARDRMFLFFTGIIEYARLLLKPYHNQLSQLQKPWTLSVVLLGNGWRLSDFVWLQQTQGGVGGGFLNAFKKELLRDFGVGNVEIDAQYRTQGAVSVKESIAYGALSTDPLNAHVAAMNDYLSIPGLPIRADTVDGKTVNIDGDSFMSFNSEMRRMMLNDSIQIRSLKVTSLQTLDKDVLAHLASAIGMDVKKFESKALMLLNNHMANYLNNNSQRSSRVSPLSFLLANVFKVAIHHNTASTTAQK